MRLVSYLVPGFPRELFERVGELIGADVWFDEERSGPDLVDDPFADGRADLGWVCSTSYVQLNRRSPSPTVRLGGVAWVPDDPGVGGRPHYFGDLVVRPGLDIGRLDDLGGHAIGCNDPVSLSGHHALRAALRERGHDPDRFVELVFTGGHHRSLDLVSQGSLDAAVVDSVVRLTRSRSDPAVADLRVAERLGPWPVQPLVVAADLDPALADRIRSRLLGATSELAPELRAAGLTGLVAVDDGHYAAVEQLPL
ncbi:MAG: PhnD/SsuA/transferrin family substrate-binding protein [Actinomycetota bacterium]